MDKLLMFLNINFQYIKTPPIPPSYKEVHTFYCLTLLHHVNYEGWNFNSGNYLFTTDTK